MAVERMHYLGMIRHLKCMGELYAQLQDSLSGLHEIQSFGQEEYESERLHEKNFSQVRAMLRALRASAVFHPSVEFLSSVGTVLVVFFGGFLAYHGQLSVEDIVAFVLYLSLFYAPVSGLANLPSSMQMTQRNWNMWKVPLLSTMSAFITAMEFRCSRTSPLHVGPV